MNHPSDSCNQISCEKVFDPRNKEQPLVTAQKLFDSEDSRKLFETEQPKTCSWFSWKKNAKTPPSRFSAFFKLWNQGMKDNCFFTRVNLR